MQGSARCQINSYFSVVCENDTRAELQTLLRFEKDIVPRESGDLVLKVEFALDYSQ